MTMFWHVADHRDHPFITGLIAGAAFFSLLSALSTSASCALAQGVAATPPITQPAVKIPQAVTPAMPPVAPKISGGPPWQALTPTQQISLMPLAAKWNTLGEASKRKWIAIAANYPTLLAPEQTKLHSRMTEWVSLSQQQREQARLNFTQSKQLDPGKKSATWQAYQALSPEEKQQLAISAPTKPTGAAAAVKPVSPQKLAAVPMTRKNAKESTGINSGNHEVNRNTLLPHPQRPAGPAPSQQNQSIQVLDR